MSDLLHLGWDDGQVGLQVAVQQVRHHHPVRHYVNHEVADTGEKFNLAAAIFQFQNNIIVNLFS